MATAPDGKSVMSFSLHVREGHVAGAWRREMRASLCAACVKDFRRDHDTPRSDITYCTLSVMSKTARPACRTYQVLDPCTLGRPVHLLGRFTDQVRVDLADELQARFNRRYRAAFRVDDVALASESPAIRWLTYDTDLGRVDFAVTRKLLLCFLAYRLGVVAGGAPSSAGSSPPPAGGAPSPAGDEAAPESAQPPVSEERETATEERMAVALGKLFIGRVVDRIETLHDQKKEDGARAERTVQLAANGSTLAAGSAWILRVGISEQARGIDGTMWIRLDERCIGRLLEGLAPARGSTPLQKYLGASASEPLPSRMRIRLTARLIEKEVTVGSVLDLRAGDVLPIRMGPADVLVGDSRLFTARVAEHKGRLCLTSFEDAE